MEKTIFRIAKMDCAAEEGVIRMKLEGIPGIHKLQFDLPDRRLTVFHANALQATEKAIHDLRLGGEKVSHESNSGDEGLEDDEFENVRERKVLVFALFVNFLFFAVEIVAGLMSRSMGLVADSLDMLADSLVYGISLAAVGAVVAKKHQAARISGYFQLALASLGMVEVIRRFFGEDLPNFKSMIVISILALFGNALTLYVLGKSKGQGAHMRASRIFTSNDILVNGLVIVSGLLVYFMNSRWPDLVAGGFIFLVVANGARRILSLSK